MTELDKAIREDWSFHLMIGCATLVLILIILASCTMVIEKEHTKQKMAGVETNKIQHFHAEFP